MRMLLAFLLLCSQAVAADGILPNQRFKLPFAVDGKEVANRATVTVDAAGKATLRVLYVKGGQPEEKFYGIVPINDPQPSPTPGPVPDPTPTPIPPAKLWGVVVYESADQTPAQSIVMLSGKVRGMFTSDQFRLLDKDTATTEPWSSYVKATAGKKLPLLFLVDDAGNVAFEGALPATVDATVALISKYKGAAK